MSLLLRKGLDADRAAMTPDSGEPIWTTDGKQLWLGDNATLGGILIGPGTAAGLTQDQIAYGDGSNLITSDANFTRNHLTFVTNFLFPAGSGDLSLGLGDTIIGSNAITLKQDDTNNPMIFAFGDTGGLTGNADNMYISMQDISGNTTSDIYMDASDIEGVIRDTVTNVQAEFQFNNTGTAQIVSFDGAASFRRFSAEVTGLKLYGATDTFIFPDIDGSNGDVLTSDGAGNLSFAPAAGGVTSVGTGTGLTGGTITGTGTISLDTKLQPADSLTGNSLKVLRVNAGETAVEYATPTTGTVTSIATTGPISGGTITSTGTITTSMSTNKLIGRGTAGTGVMEEITLGTNLTLTGTTLDAAGSSALTTDHILVGVAGVATDVAMSGDATIVASGALTIGNNAVTYTKTYNGNQLSIVNTFRFMYNY